VKFWDASAIVPLLVAEPPRDALIHLASQDPVMLVWWGSPVECVAAIARREREGFLTLADAGVAIDSLRRLAAEWQEIVPADAIRATAMRLLRVHALRAADSLQLAAAVVVADGEPSGLDFVTLDDRLAEAAQREGFRALPDRTAT
jgi:hypothetical protein